MDWQISFKKDYSLPGIFLSVFLLRINIPWAGDSQDILMAEITILKLSNYKKLNPWKYVFIYWPPQTCWLGNVSAVSHTSLPTEMWRWCSHNRVFSANILQSIYWYISDQIHLLKESMFLPGLQSRPFLSPQFVDNCFLISYHFRTATSPPLSKSDSLYVIWKCILLYILEVIEH